MKRVWYYVEHSATFRKWDECAHKLPIWKNRFPFRALRFATCLHCAMLRIAPVEMTGWKEWVEMTP